MSRRAHSMLASLPVMWLRERAIPLPSELRGIEPRRSEGVRFETKRALLQTVCDHGGEQAVLSLGRYLQQVRDEPLLFVMLNARSVWDFLDKEQRFERYFHSHHRLRVLERGAREVVLQHGASVVVPSRLESLYVLGIQLQVFEQLGCSGVRACLPSSEEPDRVFDAREKKVPRGDAQRWRIAWEDFRAMREPMAGLDDILLGGALPKDLTAPTATVERVERAIASDLAHRWTLAKLASALGMSTRSLQRQLRAEGTTFSRAVDDIRVRHAAAMLRDPARTATEIGYACGFSDPAHFSRRFRAHFGAAPKAWRAGQLRAP